MGLLAKTAKHLLGIAGGMAFLWGAAFLYLLGTEPTAHWTDQGAKAVLCFAVAAMIGAAVLRRSSR